MNGIILTNGDNIRAHPQRFKWFLLSASHLAKYGTDPRGQHIVLCLVVQYLWWSGVTTSRCLYTYPISTYGVRELPHTPYEALAGPPSERPREESVPCGQSAQHCVPQRPECPAARLRCSVIAAIAIPNSTLSSIGSRACWRSAAPHRRR